MWRITIIFRNVLFSFTGDKKNILQIYFSYDYTLKIGWFTPNHWIKSKNCVFKNFYYWFNIENNRLHIQNPLWLGRLWIPLLHHRGKQLIAGARDLWGESLAFMCVFIIGSYFQCIIFFNRITHLLTMMQTFPLDIFLLVQTHLMRPPPASSLLLPLLHS